MGWDWWKDWERKREKLQNDWFYREGYRAYNDPNYWREKHEWRMENDPIYRYQYENDPVLAFRDLN